MNLCRKLPALVAVLSVCFPLVVIAADKSSSTNSDVVAKVYAMYACVLLPFNSSYVDVAVKEKRARQKVSKRCQAEEGELNIFCKEEKAECTAVKVKIKE